MEEGRQGRVSRAKKVKNRQLFDPQISRRGRSKRRRLPGIVPWVRERNCDANVFLNIEIDVNKDQETPKTPKRIIVKLNNVNPTGNVIESSGVNVNEQPGSVNVTAWENAVRQMKSEVSELNHLVNVAVPNNEDGRHHCRCNTEDFSVVLDLNGGETENNCEMGNVGYHQDGESASGAKQFSVSGNAIKSNKDDHLRRVLVSLLDDEDEHAGAFQAGVDKRARKKAGRFRRRKQVVEFDQYLDTHIIDRCMEKLWKKLTKDKKEHCTYLDCLWFSMYLEESTSFKILKWIREKHIFSKRYVFIPIVHWGHWNLLILCHFGEDLNSEVRTPCMLLLDSLKETDPSRLEPLIRKFLVEVHKGEGRKDSDKVISRIPLLVPEVPQQTNGNDCGVFLLHFIDLFLQHAPKNFSTSEDSYPYFLTKDWFKLEAIRKRRKWINAMLLKEQDGANQMITRRISTRSKKLNGFLSSGRVSNWIDLSSAA